MGSEGSRVPRPRVHEMQITVKLPNGAELDIDVEGRDSVESLRTKVFAQYTQAHPDLQTLGFDGLLLENGHTLAEYGLHLESVLQLGIRPASQTVELCVGGKPYIATLETLL